MPGQHHHSLDHRHHHPLDCPHQHHHRLHCSLHPWHLSSMHYLHDRPGRLLLPSHHIFIRPLLQPLCPTMLKEWERHLPQALPHPTQVCRYNLSQQSTTSTARFGFLYNWLIIIIIALLVRMSCLRILFTTLSQFFCKIFGRPLISFSSGGSYSLG